MKAGIIDLKVGVAPGSRGKVGGAWILSVHLSLQPLLKLEGLDLMMRVGLREIGLGREYILARKPRVCSL